MRGGSEDASYAPRWAQEHVPATSIAVRFGFPPISEQPAVRKIEQRSVDEAFRTGNARNVTVYRVGRRQWYFTFDDDDVLTGEVVQYAMMTARGDLRMWADPRNLFEFLSERYGVRSVIVVMIDGGEA